MSTLLQVLPMIILMQLYNRLYKPQVLKVIYNYYFIPLHFLSLILQLFYNSFYIFSYFIILYIVIYTIYTLIYIYIPLGNPVPLSLDQLKEILIKALQIQKVVEVVVLKVVVVEVVVEVVVVIVVVEVVVVEEVVVITQ